MQFKLALQYTVVLKTLSMILSFIINLMMVRVLSVEDSGHFFFTIAILSLIILLLSLSLESGILYYSSSNTGNISKMPLFILALLIIQAVVCYVVLQNIEISINRYFALLYIMSYIFIGYISALYSALQRFARLNVVIFIVNFTAVIFLLVVYTFYNDQTTSSKLSLTRSVYMCVPTAQAILLLFFIPGKIRSISKPVSPFLYKNIFRYAMLAFIGNVLFFLVTRIDYYFVEKYCSADALGNYIQVSKLGQLIILLPSMMATVVFPYSASDSTAFSLQRLQVLCRAISVLFIPFTIAIILVGNWFFPWLFGKGFDAMFVTVLFYIPGFWALSLVTLLASYLAGKKLLINNLIASLLALLMVVTGDIILIPLYGIKAAALTSSAAYVSCMLYLLTVYKKKPVQGLLSSS